MAKNYIGIDIGGSKIAGVVFNGKTTLKELTIKTPTNLFEFERNLFKLVDFLSAGLKISGIGIGSAGRADPKTGTIKVSHNLKFKAELNFVNLFKKKYKLPVKVDNDASCFTRAELVVGQGKAFDNFLGITLGSGIGGGIVINNKMYRGTRNSGGEFGHIVLDKGFLERSYFHQATHKNDYKSLGTLIGRLFASLANIFAPEAIILGGGLTQNAQGKFLPLAKKEMKKFLIYPELGTKIFVSKLKSAGALGAALLFK